MLGNFTFHNPTRLHFGNEALDQLGKEPHTRRRRRLYVRLCQSRGRKHLLRRRPLGILFQIFRQDEMSLYPGRLCTHDGRHGI